MASHHFAELPNKTMWRLLVEAARQAMETNGYRLDRVPGRGLSNLWLYERNGKRGSASIRTSRDRWFAFPPLNGGQKWKTLDDVDLVLVAALDKAERPENVEVYIFDADVVRARFKAAHAARVAAGHRIKDGFGMWLRIDRDERGLPTSVGSGLADYRPPVVVYPLDELMDDHVPSMATEPAVVAETRIRPGETISHIIATTREKVAELAGVRLEAVKLDVKIEC
jgi:hypothetical protein